MFRNLLLFLSITLSAQALAASDRTVDAGVLELKEVTPSPASPSAGYRKCYVKPTDGNLYCLNSSNEEARVQDSFQSDLTLVDPVGGESITLQVATPSAGSFSLKLPTEDGTSGQGVRTDGSGNLYFDDSGDVTGPASSTDNALAAFDGITGKLLKDTLATIDGSGNITATSFIGPLTGNASTATALAANPTACASNRYATDSAANGDLTCAQVSLTAGVSGVLPSANVDASRTINSQTGTTYTFVLGDGAKAGGHTLVLGSNGSAQTFTVPPNSSVAYPVGDQIDVCQMGAGALTIAEGSGVTVNSVGSNKTAADQYVCLTLVQTAADEWILLGNLVP